MALPPFGMRDRLYKDSTPKLKVGDSAFEDWFQQQPFATQSGIKQPCRDAYAAGMGDPLVTYALPQVDLENVTLTTTFMQKIAQMEQADLLDYVMHNPDLLTDNYYSEFRRAIWKRYEELRGTT